MKDFDALKDIWSNQIALPKVSCETVLKRVKQSKNELSRKLLLEVIVMILAVAALAYAWLTLPFIMWTSHLALGIFIACCMYVIFAQYRDYRRMADSSLLLDKPGDYIRYLKNYKRSRYILNTRKYSIYTLLFSIGLLLLFVELFFIADLWLTLVGILFTLAWLLVCYFVLMKKYIRKEEAKVEEMISNLERLENQFKEARN